MQMPASESGRGQMNRQSARETSRQRPAFLSTVRPPGIN